MALSGIVLTVFVIGHLVGNLQIFSAPDHINGYAHFLQSQGALLWIARAVLLAAVIVHVWAATVLTLENKRARGDAVRYEVKHTIRATLASRTMRWTGYIVLAFVLYHLAHFSLGLAQAATFKDALKQYVMTSDYHVMGFTAVHAGEKVPDVHSMMILGFQNTVVSLFYILAVGLLSYHLAHGFDSMFQTLGFRSGKSATALRTISVVLWSLYFLGNLAIPGAVLLGKLQPRPEIRAAAAAAPQR